ncbi:MAG: terminase small subunit [bacterium]
MPQNKILTPKMKKWAREWPKDHNATQAAIRAGYSARTARQAGHRMLTDVDVMKLAEKTEAKACAKCEITVERILRGIAELAFKRRGAPRDRLKALEMLGRHKRLFIDRLEHEGTGGGPIIFALPRAGTSPEPDIPVEGVRGVAAVGGVEVPRELRIGGNGNGKGKSGNGHKN